ncbi:MAG: TOBE domain-containing protein, partial [Proteobacteria bacterium]|nr:TOBE domain-containing protein [Pseudomonadota bacterium]
VTHDQEEALSMADRVAVLNQGRLEQFGAPHEVYDHPQSLFVNTFVGTANLLPGRFVGRDGAGGRVALALGGELDTRAPIEPIAAGEAVAVCIRPENLRIADTGAGLPGTVEMGLPLGAVIVHEIRLAGGATMKISEARAVGMAPRAPGTAVRVQPQSRDGITVFRSPASPPTNPGADR